MTLTSPAPPLSDPRAGGCDPVPSILMALLRVAVLVGIDTGYGWLTPASADALGAFLTGFLITFVISACWALIDGWRRPLRTGAVAWLLTAVLYVAVHQLPTVVASFTGDGVWTDLSDFLAPFGRGFVIIGGSMTLSAALGLAIGYLARVLLRKARR